MADMRDDEPAITPAGRLYQVLRKLPAGMNPPPTTWQAFAIAFEVDPGDTINLFSRYTHLLHSLRELRDLFSDPRLLPMSVAIERLHIIERFLSDAPNLSRPINETIGALSESALDGLRMADAAIRNAGLAESPSMYMDTLELQSEIRRLLEAVDNS